MRFRNFSILTIVINLRQILAPSVVFMFCPYSIWTRRRALRLKQSNGERKSNQYDQLYTSDATFLKLNFSHKPVQRHIGPPCVHRVTRMIWIINAERTTMVELLGCCCDSRRLVAGRGKCTGFLQHFFYCNVFAFCPHLLEFCRISGHQAFSHCASFRNKSQYM